MCAALEGGGFGMVWTFVLGLTTALADLGEARRITGGIWTVQRLGYALGVICVGAIACASGLSAMRSAEAADVARVIFLACLSAAAGWLLAMTRLVRA